MSAADRPATLVGADSAEATKQRLAVSGGLLGAVAASSCCILPLVLFSVGASGPWLGQLAALTPFQPYFIAGTLGILAYGFWTVYRQPACACAEDEACGKPLPRRLLKTGLWSATGLVIAAWAFPYVAPTLLGQ